MTRRFNQNTKYKYKIHRSFKKIKGIYVFNLSDKRYLLLVKGLKGVPSPTPHLVKQQVKRDFNKFARKLKCRYMI